jgi:hypothetical protein
VEERLVVVVGGEDEAGDGRVDGPHVAAHVDAAAVREPAVEHGDVGTQRGNAAGGLLGQPRLADDLDATVVLQQLTQAAADDLVVVEQVDANLPALTGVRGGLVLHEAHSRLIGEPAHRRLAGSGAKGPLALPAP